MQVKGPSKSYRQIDLLRKLMRLWPILPFMADLSIKQLPMGYNFYPTFSDTQTFFLLLVVSVQVT